MLHPAQSVLTARVPDWEKPAREILAVRKIQHKLWLCRVQLEKKKILFLPCLIKLNKDSLSSRDGKDFKMCF